MYAKHAIFLRYKFLTLSAHAQEGYSSYVFVCLSILCVSLSICLCHKLIFKMALFYLSKRASKHGRQLLKVLDEVLFEN